MIAGKSISSRGRVLSIISFGLGMSSMANRDRVPGIHSGLPKKIFMPTPSKAIKLAYEGCETTLTLVGFSKRFLAERTRNPSLTAQAFAASPSLWARKRLAVIPTELEIGGKRIALTRISKLLGELKGTGTRYLNALKAFAREHPDRITFESLDELLSQLKHGTPGHGGRIESNPVSLDGVRYPNAARLYDAIIVANKDAIRIERRTFADRVLEERQRQCLQRNQVLHLAMNDVLAMLRLEDRLGIESFCQRVTEYCQSNVVDLVTTNGREILAEDAYDRYYKYNRTNFYFSCRRCRIKPDYKPYPKSVDKFHQGCPACAKEAAAAKRRLQTSQIRARIESHVLGLTYVSGAEVDVYKNGKSRIKVVVNECGHAFSRAYDSFRRDGEIKVCPECNQYVGETLSVSIIGYLLGLNSAEIYAARQVTPSWLKKDEINSAGHLRHDAYFGGNILPSRRDLIVEHDGFQHFDDLKAAAVFPTQDLRHQEKSRNSDKLKRAAAEARKEDVIFVCIPDVERNCRNIADALAWIVDHALKQAPEIQDVPGFDLRLRELEDPLHLLSFVSKVGLASLPTRRLLEALKEERATHIHIEGYDPVERSFNLVCDSENHDVPFTWSPLAVNVLPSKDGSDRGGRCPVCSRLPVIQGRRLSQQDLDERGAKHGLRRKFDYSEYKNNRERYDWECIMFNHPKSTSVEKMSSCAECRKLGKIAKLPGKPV
ncbi:hypothetical protein [Paraburkholderia sediminicola]|uniref:hypothetical protein n=1 Tax=Paraburkholderia sediminicola TaxID=458836 RepID=UPI0038BAB423